MITKNFSFETKAETLERLRPLLSSAIILEQVRCTVRQWHEGAPEMWRQLADKGWLNRPLVVRSSAKTEDSLERSNAGGYVTVLDVRGEESVRQAVGRVVNSYGPEADAEDQILIQPMLESVSMSGVVFTADLDTLTPYYIVNYDCSASTGNVTGGHIGGLQTFIRFKDAPFPVKNPQLARLLDTCKECEQIIGNSFLDIEFAFDRQGTLYILQVRPIVTRNKTDLNEIVDLETSLWKLHSKIEKLSIKHPNLLGDRPIYGVMPDWNPAEIIGVKPRRLALSMYRELITDNIWAYQRDNYSYRNLRSHPLLVSFLGVPFIDVRVSFNSFIPKELHESIAQKLVNYYLDQLASFPHHHDKVEFEIVHSCYYLNLPEKLEGLLECGFNRNEIKRIEFALLQLTNRVIDPEHGLYKKDLDKIEILRTRYDQILQSELSLVDKIYWLTEDCKRYGTLPFAGIARAGFIAVQFLRSFVELGIITTGQYDEFMNSLNTISKILSRDLSRVFDGELSRERFLEIYGHLRPGTYDILSARYDEDLDGYFAFRKVSGAEQREYAFRHDQLACINQSLIEHGLSVRAEGLLRFIKEAVEGREYSKFVFTRSLSQILKLVEEFGARAGCCREELSFLDIREVLNLYATLDHRDVREIFQNNIADNRTFYEYTKAIKLPSLIVSADNIYEFFIESGEPNFITLKQVQGQIIREEEFERGDLNGKIAFIPSADPGYDFLFTKGIAGLVTQYGGANSHMAIRCAELGLPAVIGAGERNFRSWSKAKVVSINCAGKQVQEIS